MRGWSASHLDRRVLVGPLVVADQVQLAPWVAARKRLEKGYEFGMAMPSIAARVHLAAGQFQRRKQAGGAVAGVIVGAPCGNLGHIGNIGGVRLSA